MKLDAGESPGKPVTRKVSARRDWRGFDALTDADVLRAARSDPDAQPLSDAQLQRMKRPNAKVVRRALGLSQEESDRHAAGLGAGAC
jgi:putative transcriptional regulator